MYLFSVKEEKTLSKITQNFGKSAFFPNKMRFFSPKMKSFWCGKVICGIKFLLNHKNQI